jgi:hypothetical protein
MKMNLKEMKTLYTFGCPNREATVERLRYVAALTPDPAAKKLFYMLSVKLSDEKCDKWSFLLQSAFADAGILPAQGSHYG